MKQHVVLNFSLDYKIPEEIMKLSLREAEILVEAGLAEIKKNACKNEQTRVRDEYSVFEKSYTECSNKMHEFYERQIEIMKGVHEMQIKAIETKLTKSNQLCDEQRQMIEKNFALIEMSLETINRLTARQ